MATGRDVPSSRGAILIVMVVAGLVVGPPPAAATDDPTVVLPGATVTTLTVDLDGDGDREIVRLVQEDDSAQHAIGYSVDAWTYDRTGWSMVGSASVPRVTSDEAGMVAGGQAGTLLLWQDAGRERVLVLSAALPAGDQTGATCCLTISELTGGGDLDLRLLQRVDGGAQSIWSADVDGVGSDELVLYESDYGATEDDQTATLRVLRWDGEAFQPAFEQAGRQLLYGFAVADTDGVAGKDLLFGPGTDGRIRRFAWTGRGMEMEEGHIDAGEPPEGWIVGVADGAIILSLPHETRVVRWPRGQVATTVDRLTTLDYPGMSIFGDGPDALIVVQGNYAFENGPPTVAVHDLGLQLLGEVGVGPGTEGFWRLVNGQVGGSRGFQHNIYPYSGPIHGGVVNGRAGYVSSGMLIQPGGPDGYEVRPMASLIGVGSVGLAGPQDGWAVLGGNYSPPSGSAYLNWGGVPPEWGRLAVMPVDLLLQPDERTSAVSIELVGAVEIAREGEAATLMAEADGFRVSITAPAGSAVIVANGTIADEHEVTDEPLVVEVGPPRNRKEDEDLEFEAMILVLTPDGRGISEQWTGTFVRELPEISVSASTDAMALSSTLTGRASSGSQVTANNLPIDTDADGRFAASIDAPIWPSQVVVTARDPLGNETTQLIEVVGVVDYRGLPWAAILIAATVLVGGVLYVRTPRRRPATSAVDDDGGLEELELDAIDAIEPRGR